MTPRPGRLRRAGPWLGALFVMLVVTATLSTVHRSTGYVRDEGIYFDASRSYAAWVDRVLEAPSVALDRKLRDRHFAPNHEHPALMKTLAGLSARWLGSAPAQKNRPAHAGLLPEGAAMRLPAQLCAGLGCALLFLAGYRRAGVFGGLLGAGAFILLPRVWFSAGLHAFDVPVAVAILAVVLAYRRAERSAAWGMFVGVLLGIAIAVKHNALFVGPLLAVHHAIGLLLDRSRTGHSPPRSAWFPLPLVSMMVLAPLVAWACWPWLWADTIPRLLDYADFHRQHSWYNTEFLGQNFNQPPMPWGYPLIMTVATVPGVVLVAALLGAVLQGRHDLHSGGAPAHAASFWTPRPTGFPRRDGLLYSLFAVFPIALISLPSTPIFGGTKHWITAYPFFALLCVECWAFLWAHADLSVARRRWMQPLFAAVFLLPGALAIRDAPTLGLSQYAPLVGGPRGAARLGLLRGFWGHATAGLLPDRPTRVDIHDMHELARRQLVRDGQWPDDIDATPLSRSDAALHFYEKHMTTHEVDVWNRFGTTAPSAVLELDDVPLTSLYER